MKNHIIILILQACIWNFASCQAVNDYSGTYGIKGSGQKLQLDSKGFYILYNSKSFGHLATDFCEYASKGQWKKISSDVIDLTSENYYLKQEGFKYDLKQESKLSKDSVYINIILPKEFEDIATPEYDLLFNYNTSKRIVTINRQIKLSKKDYSLIGVKNQLTLNIKFNAKGERFFNNRLNYNILQDYPFDVEKFNYFTISLPNFNQCFYDFEPYYHSYIYIKDKNTLMWKGEEWIKQ
ncbi:hypothetical protein SAMN06265171_101821 [Chryseobacterium rhizoplanae]|uniref:Uncharacterized protein n=1 Tax=Chryseobacterium rhizoplanae TaxID=1609531 RepID=A0A521B9R3_9FLAO|nr:hypothetical protein [Chryseobacterium rhizoplanae]SMO43829.1 hypothetical protein SAMN06265171_101821 [Chryseobacterium rhizoplanae]